MIDIGTAQLGTWIAALWWPFLRALSLLAAVPVFSSPDVPKRLQIGLAVFLAIVIQPLLPDVTPVALDSWAVFLVLSLQQLLVGIILGFAVRIAFAAVNFAGAVIGLEMGLGFATLYDPQNGVEVPALSSFLVLFGTLIFLAMNGHLILIAAFAKSFGVAPVGLAWHYGPDTWHALARWGGQLFLLGLAMALPVLTILVVANIALGVLAKIAPQLNIFVVGFPVLLLLGLAGLYLAAPLMGQAMLSALQGGLRVTGLLVGPR